MNAPSNPNDDFERELRATRPATPSNDLMSKLESALADDEAVVDFPATHDRAPLRVWLLRGAALAACVALVLALVARHGETTPQPDESRPTSIAERLQPIQPIQPEPKEPSRQFTPVQYANFLVSTRDEGLVNEPGEAPVRRVRYQYYDVCTIEDEERGERIEMIVPREEVVLIRAQIF